MIKMCRKGQAPLKIVRWSNIRAVRRGAWTTVLVLFAVTMQFAVTMHAQPERLWSTEYGGAFSTWDRSGNIVAMFGGGGMVVLDNIQGTRIELPLLYVDKAAFGAESDELYTVQRFGNTVWKARLAESEPLEEFHFVDTSIVNLGLSHDGRTGYCSYTNGTVVIWDTETGTELLRLDQPNMSRVVFDNTGTRFALLSRYTTSSSNPALIYSVNSDEPIATFGDNEVHCAFPADDDLVITTSQNGKISLWQISTGRRLKVRYWSQDISGNVAALHATSDSTILLTAGQGPSSTLTSYHLPDLEIVTTVGADLRSVGRPGTSLIAADPSGTLMILSADSLSEQRRLDALAQDQLDVAISPTGMNVALTGYDNATRLVDVADGSVTTTVTPQTVSLESTFADAPYAVIGLSESSVVKEFMTGETICELDGRVLGRLHVLSTSELLEIKSDTVRILSIPDLNTITQYPTGIVVYGQNVHLSPDGRYGVATTLASGFMVWDLHSGDTVFTTRTENFPTGPYAIDRSSSICAAVLGSDSLVNVYNMETGELLWRFDNFTTFSINGLAIVHENDVPRYLVATCGGTDPHGLVWDLSTGEMLHRLDGHDGLVGTAIALNNTQRVVTRSNDMSVRIWDVRSGEERIRYAFSAYPSTVALLGNEEALLIVDEFGNGALLSLEQPDTLTTFTSVPRSYHHARHINGRSVIVGGYDVAARRVEAWDFSSYLPVSVNKDVVVNKGPRSATSISIVPHPVVAGSMMQVRFSKGRHQRVTVSDVTGRTIGVYAGSGTLEPQTFSLGVVSPLTEFMLIKAECEGDVVVKGAVVAGE